MKVSVIIPVGHKDQNFKVIDQIKEKFESFEIIVAALIKIMKQKILRKKLINFYPFTILQEPKH
jgi:hypothetical protein